MPAGQKPFVTPKPTPPASSWWLDVPREAWGHAVHARHVQRKG
jgi:hypothetical protein